MFLEYCFECHTLAWQEPNREKKRRNRAPDLTGYAGAAWTQRMLKEPDDRSPKSEEVAIDDESVGEAHRGNPVRAKGPNDIWQLDLTVVPTAAAPAGRGVTPLRLGVPPSGSQWAFRRCG